MKYVYNDKKIKDIEISDLELIITFDDNKKIRVFDDGQNCCEKRYMTVDETPRILVGNKLISIQEKPVEALINKEDYEVHEVVFLEITTDKASLTIASHNEHNGYYGGFDLKIEEI